MDAQQVLPSSDFSKELPQFNSIISEWRQEEDNCKKRRELRQNKKSVIEEQQKGTIAKDETIIPDRTIASNIRRSKVPYTNYVSKAQRILIITDTIQPKISIESLELWFTRGMRYPGWKTPWFKLIDSFQVHGGSPLEVVFDSDNPLNCGLEYILRQELLFPRLTRNIQAAPRILRRYDVTISQLEEFTAKYGFDPKIANDLYEKFHRQENFITLYRPLMKINGIVHNAWYAVGNDRDWLRPPLPHDIGLLSFDMQTVMQPMPGQSPDEPTIPFYATPAWDPRLIPVSPQPLISYPIFWFTLQETEVEELLDEQGRVSMDLNVQEAMMRLLTNTVNASTRASACYPCAENEPGGNPDLEELGPIKPNTIMSRKLTFNQFPWPTAIILAVMQALKVGKADESGQTDFAATARKDANKTAKELELATEQANLVVSSDLDVFSTPYLEVYALCFNIACQQAVFNRCQRPIHPELLLGDYNLQPASDVEVLKRAEDKDNAKEFFNIVKGTPAAEKILKFLIQRFFPDQADEWIAELSQPDLRGLVMQLVQILQQIPTDELPPEQKLALGNIITTAQQLVGAPNDGSAPPQPGVGQSQPPQQSNAGQQAA